MFRKAGKAWLFSLISSPLSSVRADAFLSLLPTTPHTPLGYCRRERSPLALTHSGVGLTQAAVEKEVCDFASRDY